MSDHRVTVVVVTDNRPSWHADLPELDDAGRRYVLAVLADVLAYRDVTRDDVREAYANAARLAAAS